MLDGFMDEDNREYITGGWFVKKATLGGGVFFSASAHLIDVMLWIAGEVQTVSMVGAQAGLPMEGEDTALSVIKFKSGVVGTTRHTWFSPKPHRWYTMRAYCQRAVITLEIQPLGSLAGRRRQLPLEVADHHRRSGQGRASRAGERRRAGLDRRSAAFLGLRR